MELLFSFTDSETATLSPRRIPGHLLDLDQGDANSNGQTCVAFPANGIDGGIAEISSGRAKDPRWSLMLTASEVVGRARVANL